MFGPRIVFADRTEAGRLLGSRLAPLKGGDMVVLALPRGGVPVAAEIADALGAPLDVLLVRKLGAPGNPELAVGAIVDSDPPQEVLNEDIIDALGVRADWLERERHRQREEIARRRQMLRSSLPPLSVRGRRVVVVDDGVATGATAAAAVAGVRQAGAVDPILAVPVIQAGVADRFRRGGTEVVALTEPEDLGAVGAFYRDFRQVSDDEVRALLLSRRQEEHKGTQS